MADRRFQQMRPPLHEAHRQKGANMGSVPKTCRVDPGDDTVRGVRSEGPTCQQGGQKLRPR